MMNYRITNKWLVVIGALSAQLAIGALYAWSIFNKPIATAFNTTITSVYVTYTIALASFALTMILSGEKQLAWGPRKTALLGGILYSGGVLLSSLATNHIMLYVTYGIITGSGVAFVYVCPLSTLVKWFPNKKGLVTGVATAGFALGGFTFKYVYSALFNVPAYTPEVVSNAFLVIGLIFAVMTIGGALLLDVPQDAKTLSKVAATEGRNYSRKEMLKTGTFYKLLISDLLALMPGLLVIGLAKNIGEQFAGLDAANAGLVVAAIAIVNASGRLASGFLADKLGALKVYRSMYAVTIVSLAVLAFVQMNVPIFLIAIFGVAVGYGSFLSLVPTITGSLFGGKFFSSNYAMVFQAYGIAALIGPVIKKATEGNFSATFTIAMTTSLIGLIFAMMINPAKVQTPAEEIVEPNVATSEL